MSTFSFVHMRSPKYFEVVDELESAAKKVVEEADGVLSALSTVMAVAKTTHVLMQATAAHVRSLCWGEPNRGAMDRGLIQIQ